MSQKKINSEKSVENYCIFLGSVLYCVRCGRVETPKEGEVMKNNLLTDMGHSPSAVYKDTPNQMRILHLHPHYELYFCPKGVKQKIVLNGKEQVYEGACAILVPPFFLHSMSALEEEAFLRICLFFGEKSMEAFSEQHLPQRIFSGECLFFELTEDQASRLLPVARIASMEGFDLSDREREITFALLLSMLFRLCPEEKIRIHGSLTFYIQQVFQYVAENYMYDISAESVAREFSISRSKLNRDLRNFAGCTLHDFLDLCRLNRAKDLLQRKDRCAIDEVGQMCGFRNASYFYIFFRKHMGLSPLDYRRMFYGNEPPAVKKNQ